MIYKSYYVDDVLTLRDENCVHSVQMLCDYSFSFIFFGVFLAFSPRSFFSASPSLVHLILKPTIDCFQAIVCCPKKASAPIKCTECVQYLIFIAKLLFAKCDFVDGVPFKLPIWISGRVLSHTRASLYISENEFFSPFFSPQIILNEISSQLVVHVFQWNISITLAQMTLFGGGFDPKNGIFVHFTHKQGLNWSFELPFLSNLFLICDYELECCAG